jgi:hypothetical protein
MVKRPIVSKRPLAPKGFSGKKNGANRKRHNATKTAVKPRV